MFYTVSDDALPDDTVAGISVECLNIGQVLSLVFEVSKEINTVLFWISLDCCHVVDFRHCTWV